MNVRSMLRKIAMILSLLIIGGAAWGASMHDWSQFAVADDSNEPRYATVADAYAWDNTPFYIAEALRNCPGNEAAYYVNAFNQTEIEPAKLRPCVHAMPVFGLKGDKITVLDADNTDYTMRVIGQRVMGDAIVDTYTTLDFYIGDNIVFAGLVRQKANEGGDWSSWKYTTDVSTRPNGATRPTATATRSCSSSTTRLTWPPPSRPSTSVVCSGRRSPHRCCTARTEQSESPSSSRVRMFGFVPASAARRFTPQQGCFFDFEQFLC